jgi:hypothetical protein
MRCLGAVAPVIAHFENESFEEIKFSTSPAGPANAGLLLRREGISRPSPGGSGGKSRRTTGAGAAEKAIGGVGGAFKGARGDAEVVEVRRRAWEEARKRIGLARAVRRLEEFEKYKEALFDAVVGALSPLYGRVCKRYWDDSQVSRMKRPYQKVDFENGLYAVAIPTFADPELKYHALVVKVVEELSPRRFEELRERARDEGVRALEGEGLPRQFLDGVSVYVIAPRYGRGEPFRFMRAVKRREAREFYAPIIGDAGTASIRALSWFASYLSSRLDGLISDLSRSRGLPPWEYTPNLLSKLLRGIDRASARRDRARRAGVKGLQSGRIEWQGRDAEEPPDIRGRGDLETSLLYSVELYNREISKPASGVHEGEARKGWTASTANATAVVLTDAHPDLEAVERCERAFRDVGRYLGEVRRRIGSLSNRVCLSLERSMHCLCEVVEFILERLRMVVKGAVERVVAGRVVQLLSPLVERALRRGLRELRASVESILERAKSAIMERAGEVVWERDLWLAEYVVGMLKVARPA